MTMLKTLLFGIALSACALHSDAPLNSPRRPPITTQWLNLEGGAEWWAGPKPSRLGGLHWLTLAPGESALVEIPSGEWLRALNSEPTPLSPASVLAWRGNGSGLYDRDEWWANPESGSLLLPPRDHPSLARLERPSTHATPIRLALFLSSRKQASLTDPAAPELSIPAPRRQVRLSDQATAQNYYQLTPGQAYCIPVGRQQGLWLDSRFLYPATTGRARQTYSVRVRDQQLGESWLEFSSTLERDDLTTLDGAPCALGRSRGQWLPLGGRPGWIEIESSAPLLLRLQVSNRRPSSASDISRLFETNPALQPNLHEATLREAMFQRAQHRGQLFNPQVRAQANALWDQYTFYRNLYPATWPENATPRWARFSTTTLAEAEQNSKQRLLFPAFLAEESAQAAKGIFAPLANESERRYCLPSRSSDSVLRVAIHTSQQMPGDLIVRFDQLPAQTLRVWPIDLGQRGICLDGHAASAETNLTWPWICAATAEILLPRNTRTITISAPHATNSRPVWISLSYRSAAPYRLDDGSLIELRTRNMTELAAVRAWLESDRPLPASPWRQRLLSHWQPLKRYMENLAAQAQATVAPLNLTPRAAPLEAAQTARLTQAATDLETQGQYLAALEIWTTLYNSASNADSARRRAIHCLDELGEYTLAEIQWHGWWLATPQTEAGEMARKELDQLYQRLGRSTSRLQLAAQALRMRPQAIQWQRLCARLLEAGEYDLCLDAGLLLENADQPHEILLAAAFRQRCGGLFPLLIQGVPPGEAQRYWKDLFIHTSVDPDGAPPPPYRPHLLPSDEVATTDLPNEWDEQSALLLAAEGGGILLATANNIYSHWLVSSAARPATWQISGPARIRLRMRPLHPPPGNDGLLPWNGWAKITCDGTLQAYPINRNLPNLGLEWIGNQPRGTVAGSPSEYFIEVGPGTHEITCQLNDLTAIAQLHLATPLLPPPLPILLPSENPDPAHSGFLVWADLTHPQLPVTRRRAPIPGATLSCVAAAKPSASETWAATPQGRIAAFLMRAERDPAAADAALTAAAQLLTATDPLMQPFLTRLRQLGSWEPLSAVVTGPGFRRLPLPSASGETPSTRVRQTLLPPPPPAAIRIQPGEMIAIGIETQYPLLLEWEVTVESVAGLAIQACSVQTKIDADCIPPLALHSGQPRGRCQHPLAPGNHILEIDGRNLPPNHALLLQWGESTGNNTPRRPWTDRRQRTYALARHDAPLHVRLSGPAWVRVDELSSSGVRLSREIWVNETIQDYWIVPGGITSQAPDPANPGDPNAESLVRLFAYRFSGLPAAHLQPPPRALQAIPWIAAPEPTEVPPPTLRDVIPLGGQEDGTWSAGTIYQRRDGEVEDDGDTGLSDSFLQFLGEYRFHPPAATHYDFAKLAVRLRPDNAPASWLGHIERLWGLPRQPWQFSLGATWIGQKISDPPTSGIAWNQHLQGQIRRRFVLAPRWQHSLSLRFFQRFLNSLALHAPLKTIRDPDLATEYKRQHRFAIVLEYTLWGHTSPRHQWFTSAQAVSNSRLSSAWLDYWGVQTGWKSAWGWLQSDLRVRFRHYQADTHRDTAFNRVSLSWQACWDLWLSHTHRLQWVTTLQHEFQNHRSSLAIGFLVHLGRGRGYEDFSASAMDFKALFENERLWRFAPSGNLLDMP